MEMNMSLDDLKRGGKHTRGENRKLCLISRQDSGLSFHFLCSTDAEEVQKPAKAGGWHSNESTVVCPDSVTRCLTT